MELVFGRFVLGLRMFEMCELGKMFLKKPVVLGKIIGFLVCLIFKGFTVNASKQVE